MSRASVVRKLRPPALGPVQVTCPFQREHPANLGFILAIPEDAKVVAPGDGVVSAIGPARPTWRYTLPANHSSLCLHLDHGDGVRTYLHGFKSLVAVPGRVRRGDVLGLSTGEVFLGIEVDRVPLNPAKINSFFVPRDGQIFFEQPNFIAQAPTVVRDLVNDVRVAVESTLNYFIRPGGGLVLFNVAFNGNGSKAGLAATGVSGTDYWNTYDPVDFFITGYTCGSGYGHDGAARYFNLPALVPLRTYLNTPSKVFLERIAPLTSIAGAGASWDEMLAAWIGGYSGPTPYVNAFNLRGLPRGDYLLYLYSEQGTFPASSTFQVTVDGTVQTASTVPTGASAFVENDNYVVFELPLGARSCVEIVSHGYLSGLQIIKCAGAYTPPLPPPPPPPPPPTTYTISGTCYYPDYSPLIGAEVRVDGVGTVYVDDSGYYAVTVPAGYSGTVAPWWTDDYSVFDPPARPYADVNADQLNQDYMVTSWTS